jgi:hypothetical protein
VLRESWSASEPAGLRRPNTAPPLFEQTDYSVFVESAGGQPLEIHHDDPDVVRAINYRRNQSVAYGKVNFGSNIGQSTFEIRVAGRTELSITVEVFPTKIDYESDYRALLHEVHALSLGLALEFLRSTYRTGAFAPHQGSTVEWLDLLRALLGDLERAIEQIDRRPYRSLVAEAEVTRLDRVRRPDRSVRRSLLGHRTVHDFPATVQSLPRRPSFQNAENGWIAAQLQAVARRLTVLTSEVRSLPASSHHSAEIAQLDALAARVARMRRSEPIVASADVVLPNFASLQLMRLPGYREAYLSLIMLRLGLSLEGEAIRLSTKEINVLYEYWCYLSVVRLLSKELGSPPKLDDLFRTTSTGLSIRLQRGHQTQTSYTHEGRRIYVTYNPLFTRGLLASQQPDITVAIEDRDWPTTLMVLDAKYRLDPSPEYVQRYGVPGPPEDAINGLHRYRDALLETSSTAPVRFKRSVVQGAALYPYSETEPGAFGRSRLWEALESLGIGAIPALPSGLEYLRLWIRNVLRHGGWEIADLAIPHTASDQASTWRRAQRDFVLVVPSADAQSLETGAVIWFAAFSESDFEHLIKVDRLLVARESTPGLWQINTEVQVSAASASVEGIAFRVHGAHTFRSIGWREGELPLRPPFLTTALAADRARTAPELLLRTETEWRLREQLATIGMQTRLDLHKSVSGLSPEAAWTIGAAGDRVRHDGRQGFRLTMRDGSELAIHSITDVLTELARQHA